jgi:hypothetical protein
LLIVIGWTESPFDRRRLQARVTVDGVIKSKESADAA